MRLHWVLVLFLVLAVCPPVNAFHVAIFDFDDRLGQQDSVARYIEKKLKLSESRIRVKQFSGRGDKTSSVKILKALDAEGYALIITVTSDALVIAHHTLLKTPVLYTNVNNPLSLGFRTLGPPGGNISGASYYVSIEKQLRLYRKIQPGLKKVGFIFDRDNMSRRVELPEARLACQRLGLAYGIEIISEIESLKEKALRLVEEGVDAVIATSSNKIYQNISAFIAVCDRANLPVYSFNKEGVKQGAVAALASDLYLMVDELVLPMAMRVLGETVSPGTMPAAFLKENVIYLNDAQIGKLNLTVPEEIYEKAVLVE